MVGRRRGARGYARKKIIEGGVSGNHRRGRSPREEGMDVEGVERQTKRRRTDDTQPTKLTINKNTPYV